MKISAIHSQTANILAKLAILEQVDEYFYGSLSIHPSINSYYLSSRYASFDFRDENPYDEAEVEDAIRKLDEAIDAFRVKAENMAKEATEELQKAQDILNILEA